MKITCPNCKKKYTVDPAKLPPSIKSAKCKACGQMIPLIDASAKSSAKPVPIVNIACRYCGQRRSLRKDKIPPTAKTVKCKSCGRPVPLSRAMSPAPVHSLEKELSAPASDKPLPGPVDPAAVQDDLIRFTCAGCGKRYKIPRNKIPPTAGAVKCKACGHRIQLPPKSAAQVADDCRQTSTRQDKTAAAVADAIPQQSQPSAARAGKRKWLVAAAVCVLLIGTLGALVNFNILRIDWLNQFLPGKAEETAKSSQLLKKEPLLALNLNVPLILNALEYRLEPDKKTARMQMIMSMMKSMDLRQVEIYVYVGPDNQVLPVILARTGRRQQLEKILNGQESFKKYLNRQSDGTYRLKREAINDAKKYDLPAEPYQVALINSGAVLAPVSISGTIKENPQLLTGVQVAKFAREIGTRQDLAAIAIRIPEYLGRDWEKQIQNHPGVQATPQVSMIAGMGTAMISQLTGSLKPVEILALGFRFTGKNGRALSYAQQFRAGVDGEKIYRQLASEDPDDMEVNSIIRNIINLFKDQRYRHTLDFKDNLLSLEFSWSEKEDEAFLTALTHATVGQLFAGSMELPSTPGEVESRYTAEPNIVTSVETEQLKAKLAGMVKDSLFPGHYWDIGDTPQMTLAMDTLDLPNAAMAGLNYEVKSIKSPDGRDVLRIEESKFKPRLQPGSPFPGNISLNIKKGTPPDDLGRASIYFNLTVPVALEVFEFSADDQPGSTRDAAGIQVSLGRLQKDVAQVNSSGGKSMRLIAYDHTGRALASRESMSTPSSISSRFEGIISTLKVLVTREMLEYPFAIEVDLNRGKEIVLSREPEIPPRVRFNPHPVASYINFRTEDIENLNVEWMEGKENSWNDSLSVKLPQGPFSGHAVWEVHFFGNNKPLFLTGSSVQGSRDFSFTLDKGKLKQASAAFGKVELNLHTDISRLVFEKPDDGQPGTQKLQSGKIVSIEFNKNEITWRAGNTDVIQTVAYDARGKRLKQDQYSRSKGGNRVIYFWGVPVKFEMDISTRTLTKLIPFDIRKHQVDEEVYSAFKQSIENQREVVRTIKTIDRARRKDRSYYGDDLAGLYYLHHSKNKIPLKLISREIAHSDPAGQKRFGYTVKPYRGYYFTVLSGVESNGVKKDYSHRSKKSRFSWQNGTITTSALTRHPDLVAIPEDKALPTFFLQWGQVYMKPLNGERLEYLPDGYYNKGWIEAKFIDG